MCDVSLENFQRIVDGIGTEDIVIKNVLDPSEETKKVIIWKSFLNHCPMHYCFMLSY